MIYFNIFKFYSIITWLRWPQERQLRQPQERPRGATPLQGQEQRLPFAGAALLPHVQGKRNPSKTVGTEKGHQRADRPKPQSQTTGQSDHTDHSLV